jgi:hypothetical protein
VQPGFAWFRKGISGAILRTRYWTFGFHKGWWISWSAQRLLVSQKGFSSTKLGEFRYGRSNICGKAHSFCKCNEMYNLLVDSWNTYFPNWEPDALFLLAHSVSPSRNWRTQFMNRLRPLKHWDRGFQSHSRHGCLCAFILCLCCSVCS